MKVTIIRDGSTMQFRVCDRARTGWTEQGLLIRRAIIGKRLYV